MNIIKKNTRIVITLLALIAAGCSSSSSSSNANDAQSEPQVDVLNVAYFLEWPTPNLVAKAENRYAERLGVEINWLSFNSGMDMMRAMVAGEIDIAYSPGLAPFVAVANEDAPLQTVAVATEYEANPCVVGNESGIDSNNASSFSGKTVAVPLGAMSEYSFLRQMRSLGVNLNEVVVVNQTSSDASNALINGTADMACIFGSDAIDTALMSGSLLLTRSEMESRGIIAFDVVVVTNALANSNPSLIKEFLRVTDEYNTSFQATQPELDLIANESLLDQQTILNIMNETRYPSSADQLSEYMVGDGLVVQAFDVAGEVFLSEDGVVLSDYMSVINASFLQ